MNTGRRGVVRHASSANPTYWPNMDLMRYALSLAVIVAHLDYLTGYAIPFPLTSFEAVGGFFAISGFLMYPNYIRHRDPVRYTLQRARRILPPYMFIVLGCALGFCLISDIGIGGYFRSEGLWEYLAANVSFLNWLHPDLPGVFQGGPYVSSAVNGSLWSMKVEWCLYFSVPCFVWLLGRSRRIRRHWLALAVIAVSIGYRLVLTSLYASTGNEAYNILSRQIFGQLSFFYAGMLVFFIKDFFSSHIWTILGVGILLRCLLPYAPEPLRIAAQPFVISAVVLALSLLPYDIRWLRHRNNFSYELYLFHFPVIQLAIALGLLAAGKTALTAFVFVATILLSYIVHRCFERWLRHRRH